MLFEDLTQVSYLPPARGPRCKREYEKLAYALHKEISPYIIVLIFWISIIFANFSLFADPKPIVVGALFVFALSAAAAIFLVLELGQPFSGIMQISNVSVRSALAPL